MAARLLGVMTLTVALALVLGAPAAVLAGEGQEPTRLEVRSPEGVELGEAVRIEAVLTTESGTPVPGAVIKFFSPFSWGVWGAMEEGNGGEEASLGEETEGMGTAPADEPKETGMAPMEEEAPAPEKARGAEMAPMGEEASASEESQGAELVLGSARTDANGVATLLYEVRREGDLEITARFLGSEGYAASAASGSLLVQEGAQLYRTQVGIRIPLLGAWVIGAVLATVWGAYFVVGLLIYGIASPQPAGALATSGGAAPAGRGVSRREFLQRTAAPLGMMAFVGSAGLGIQAILARNPSTHNHLRGPDGLKKYARTPFVPLEQKGRMKPIPAVLEREISFKREVLPILLQRGGPHTVPSKNSPPPGGVRLDSYEHIMDREGLVVPGRPEESEMVEVLLDEVMYMPPIRNAPLPEEHVQLIVSWIAQGARNT